MKAIVISEYGGPEKLVIQDLPVAKPSRDQVLVAVKAFGVNRAETYMRKGTWGNVAKVSGIECVGVVSEDPSGRFLEGQKVTALMGGLGRTLNGSYAEFTCAPVSNVIPFTSSLDWEDLAAVPESYATAWTCLHENMHLQSGQTVFVRGGTSALGQATINIACNTPDITVIASTRRSERTDLLKQLGAAHVLIENPVLKDQMRKLYPDGIDSVLDLVGNSTLPDSLAMVRKGGYVCNAGFLGGRDPLEFNPLMQMPSGVNLNFFGSFMYGTREFPLSSVPMQNIIDKVGSGVYKAKPTKVFEFKDITKAHELMEANGSCGKIVVRV
ncbi:MAG: zinc-binding dehydrogenase [Acidobacteriia bacterium]|nr:zinc-binding dehydrogenase [Terriglobia bacterium]